MLCSEAEPVGGAALLRHERFWRRKASHSSAPMSARLPSNCLVLLDDLLEGVRRYTAWLSLTLIFAARG
jgi:hypothetical protein